MTRTAARVFDPVPVVERYRDLVPDWEGFIAACGRPLPVTVWTNGRRLSPHALARLLAEDGIEARALAWNPAAFRLEATDGSDIRKGLGRRWWYRAGLAHSQEEVSQIPVVLLDPQPGERVLDLCAAPGGKTAQIAVAMDNRGTVVANDIALGRMQPLRGNLERLGLLNICITCFDGSNYPRAAGLFDRVLVDGPCSCEGTLRRHKLPGRCGPETSAKYARSQLGLMRRAVALCRPGGRIVYSTCTFAPEENEAVVDRILREFPDHLRLRPARLDGFGVRPGIRSWNGVEFLESVTETARIWPHDNDTGGFYVAVFERVGGPMGESVEVPPIEACDAPGFNESCLAPYGLDRDSLGDALVHRRSSKGWHVAAKDLRPPLKPEMEAAGFLALGLKAKPAKPTTQAVGWLAPLATRQVVDLDERQRDDYLERRVIVLDARQVEACESGYVMVRYRGFGLGSARLDRVTRELGSLFPKHR